ncbi:MAG: DUF302 domain-containing protein [Candidatus Kapaibacterium sp.]
MKKSVLIIAFFFAALSAKAQTNEMFIESESRFDFNETVKILTETITNNGWKISVVHDLQESMKKANKEVLPIKVFEVCNPKHSYRLLSQDDKKIYSSLMPCRFSVYEKSDGKVYLSRMNTSMLSKQIGGLVEEVMIDATNETEAFLKSVMK